MWLELFFTAATLLLGAILYSSRNNNYWKNRGVPYVPPRPFLGSIPLLPFVSNKKKLTEFDKENLKKYGRVFGSFEGSKPVLFVSEPELIKDITIKEFAKFNSRRPFNFADEISRNLVSVLIGEKWRKVRNKISPNFSSGKMRKMVPLIEDCINTACNNLKEMAVRNKSVDLKKIYGTFTMDAIATLAFGTKLDSHHDPDNPFVRNVQKFFKKSFNINALLMFIFPQLIKIFKLSMIDAEALKFFREISEKIIEERKANKEIKRYDFLQMMLDEFDENLTEDDNESKGLNKLEILAQSILFFFAGYETSASTLAYCSYNLAFNPDCQDKLFKEVQQVLKETKGVLDYDTIKKMPYLEAVVNETLRVFSPGLRIERMCYEDYALGNTGIVIPKGMIVQIPVHAIHHCSDFWPYPDRFSPERFLGENKENIQPFTYLPFGSGPRNCVAERFALMEVKLCLSRVIQRFSFHKAAETNVPIKTYFSQGILVPTDITLLVKERN